MTDPIYLPEDGPEPSHDPVDGARGRKPTVQLVADLAHETMTFFHTDEGIPVAVIRVDDHLETSIVGSGEFKRRFAGIVYEETGQPCSEHVLVDACSALAAHAQYRGREVGVHLRVARLGDVVYLDLTNPTWEVVKLTAEGWAVEEAGKLRFRRNATAKSHPRPVPGGDINLLKSFVNVSDENDFKLLVSFLVHALLGQGPFPILVWQGQKGSAKSTSSRFTKALVDPSRGALRAPPRQERDLSVAATTNYLLAYDNLSGLSSWMADAMCRLSTGGAFAGRQLYTDAEEYLLEFVRPLILNSIDDLLLRADLADRALLIGLEEIPPSHRRPEGELRHDFEAARPQLLGALLDLVAGALRVLPDVELREHPRMADFARTGVAVERAAGWAKGAFLKALEENRRKTMEVELGADPVVDAVIRLAKGDSRGWCGTATHLLEHLAETTSPSLRQGPGWPNGARSLSDRLRRLEPALRHVGIHVAYSRTNSARTIHITRQQDAGSGEVIDE